MNVRGQPTSRGQTALIDVDPVSVVAGHHFQREQSPTLVAKPKPMRRTEVSGLERRRQLVRTARMREAVVTCAEGPKSIVVAPQKVGRRPVCLRHESAVA